MEKLKIGDQVTVYFNQIPVTGYIIFFNEKQQKYLVRLSAQQQLYYTEAELRSFAERKKIDLPSND